MTDAPLPPLPVPRLYDSLSRRVTPFVPIHAGEARVYSCGPTVYSYAHIGNLRAYVFVDTLGRVLEASGHRLRHIINITDVGHLTDDADAGEDKLERAAASQRRSIWDIAAHYTTAFKDDFAAIGNRPPAKWTVATDYIAPMIAFAQSIEAHCYRLDSGLYFDTASVADYGRLARAVDTDAAPAAARIEPVAGKRNPADFAIWRTTPPGETRQMEWDSPWGKGAPGWHLECSVMAEAELGFPFDIHTGGIDHREIHHPNEIAQNQARCGCDDTGAGLWMHNNFLVDRSGKMAKSSGDVLRLATLTDRGIHPRAFRLMCLQAHYRSELEFSWDGLAAALTRLKRLVMAVERLRADAVQTPDAARHQTLDAAWRAFGDALADDLNTPVALTQVEAVLSAKRVPAAARLAMALAMDRLLGLGLADLSRVDLRLAPAGAMMDEDSINERLDARRAARAAGDYAAGDAIRDGLAAAGVAVMDGDPLGWDWVVPA